MSTVGPTEKWSGIQFEGFRIQRRDFEESAWKSMHRVNVTQETKWKVKLLN
jgi:hypothetical protein